MRAGQAGETLVARSGLIGRHTSGYLIVIGDQLVTDDSEFFSPQGERLRFLL